MKSILLLSFTALAVAAGFITPIVMINHANADKVFAVIPNSHGKPSVEVYFNKHLAFMAMEETSENKKPIFFACPTSQWMMPGEKFNLVNGQLHKL